jgi:serine O-acetyltransferase
MMIVSPKVIFTEERGSSEDRNAGGSRLFENLKDDVPLLQSRQKGVKSGLPLPDLATVEEKETVDLASKDEFPALGEEDKLWVRIREEARWDSVKEPVLASYLYSSILSHGSLERALAFHLGNKLSSSTLLSTQLFSLIIDTFMEDDGIRRAVREDIKVVKGRDPACNSYSHCLLNFKGFLACQTHRVAHRLWNQGRQSLALALQSRVSEVFHVDIHPAAKIGSGILFDHATGLVVGETAIIGNNVSILHHVTLGGTGALGGDRHPKIGDGVLIGAGAIILGNVKIGEGAKIGAGSLVLINVPPRTMAVGNPAHLVGGKDSPAQLKEIPSQTMDHTSFMKGWFDYVI